MNASKSLWVMMVLLASAGPARAQDRYVGGVVVDSVTGRPLNGAQAYFTTLPGQNRTYSDGRFRLIASSPRDSVIVVRRIGYVPRTVVVPPDAPMLATMDIGPVYLRPVATALDQIAVEVENARRFPVLEGFYQRKANLGGLGHFLTREAVERSPALRTSDLLRASHKLEIECGKSVGAQCIATSRRARETRVLARARDSTNIEDEALTVGAGRCRMEVWVDGIRSPFDLDAIPVEWIVGVEIYSGPATTPAIFGMGPCGVVAIWTAVAGS